MTTAKSNWKPGWMNSIPALVALGLAGVYALGAASVIGQMQKEDLNAAQVVPLVPIDQILGRGIGAITSVALLAIPVGLMTALGIFQFESSSIAKKGEPELTSDSQGIPFPSSWAALAILIAAILFIPGDYLTMIMFGLITMFVIIDIVRKTMTRHGKANWRPAAFLGGYLGFVLVATLFASIVRPDPLPRTVLDLREGGSIRGSLVVSTNSSWYIAGGKGRIVAVPMSNAKQVSIEYLDPEGSENLFERIIG